MTNFFNGVLTCSFMEAESSGFNLGATLDSGQVFRYEKIRDWYFLVVGGNIVRIKQAGGKLVWRSLKPFDAFRYFDLGSDSEHELSKEKFLADAVKKYSGLKVMNQGPLGVRCFLCVLFMLEHKADQKES